MSTKLAQSIYRRQTKRGDDSVAPLAGRVEHDRLAPLISSADRARALQELLDGYEESKQDFISAHITLLSRLTTVSRSSYAGFSRAESGHFVAIVEDVDKRWPTPSQSVDVIFGSLLDRSLTIVEAKLHIRDETMHAPPRDDEAAWRELNKRRIGLIEKKHLSGLDAEQTAELEKLNREVSTHVQEVAPRSMEAIDEFADYVRRLKEKAAAKKGNKA